MVSAPCEVEAGDVAHLACSFHAIVQFSAHDASHVDDDDDDDDDDNDDDDDDDDVGDFCSVLCAPRYSIQIVAQLLHAYLGTHGDNGLAVAGKQQKNSTWRLLRK